ncbi:MAG: class A beta-lactamase-related serine hydrolase [Armatimonadetes bacterium]|nr:class A beta-lactamase-related serine hydrolase [Armatimonadota bacterium]
MASTSDMESAISAILKRVAGVFGVVARRVDGNDGIMLNENEVFPSASVIKVPMMVDLFCLRDEGRLSFTEVVSLRDEYKVEGPGALKELHAGLELTVLDLIILMIVQSDNTATNMIIDRVGMDSVNDRMRGLGLQKTTLARRMYDWEAQAKGFENVCTPSEIATLLVSMVEGSISSKSTSTEMLEIMARQQWRERIPLLLPEGTKVANKTGSIAGVTHDVGVVYGPSGPYVLCVMTKGVSDAVAAGRAIAEVSKSVYEFYCS